MNPCHAGAANHVAGSEDPSHIAGSPNEIARMPSSRPLHHFGGGERVVVSRKRGRGIPPPFSTSSPPPLLPPHPPPLTPSSLPSEHQPKQPRRCSPAFAMPMVLASKQQRSIHIRSMIPCALFPSSSFSLLRPPPNTPYLTSSHCHHLPLTKPIPTHTRTALTIVARGSVSAVNLFVFV